MVQLIGKRLIALVPLLFLVSLMVFSLVMLVPGDPAVTIAGENATEAQIDATRERLGLNDPVVVQYGRWVGNALQGDLGESLFSSQSVTDSIRTRFPTTFSLTLGAVVVALAIGIPAGIIAATRQGTWIDRLTTLGATAGVAVPNYVLGLLLILFFAIWRPWLPATGYVSFSEDPGGWLRHLILPAITLGTAGAAVVARQLRSSLYDVLQQDYVRTASAKGLRRSRVVLKHGMKNAAVPVVTVLGLQISFLLGGTVIVEVIFGIPGLGQLAISAVQERDIPLIQGIVVATTVIVVVVNLVVDLFYGYLNPRVRSS